MSKTTEVQIEAVRYETRPDLDKLETEGKTKQSGSQGANARFVFWAM